MNTDLTFFTNEPGSTLADRFKKTLKDAQFFDVLVGYFRTSGFHRLYEAMESIEKNRKQLMNFDHLVSIIEQTSIGLGQRALTSVNQALVIRNWLIGYYLVEYDQEGEDSAKYGEKLLESITNELKKKKIKGMSITNLRLFRKFYETYPQIRQPLADQLGNGILQTPSESFRPICRDSP